MQNPLPLHQSSQSLSIPHRLFNLIHNTTSTSLPLLSSTKILIIGVGGIGCQILKVLSKMPISTVHIIDMDTIQLSNLNRQFLFKKEHKGMSKALVARESVLKINPDFDIVAHHKNIKELPIKFFQQFQFLVMALDNVQARNYVNKIGVRLNIPIIDAGTLGYKGNVTTIIPKLSKCYSCEPKINTQKQFPVCTIRMRPQKPIHCIVWAKLLFEVLFGQQNQDNDLKDLSQLAKKNDVVEIMSKIFQSDILDIKNAKSDSDNKLSEIFAKSIKIISKQQITSNLGNISLEKFIKHDTKLTLFQNIDVFSQSFNRLIKHKNQNNYISFQKDDDNIIHFISSAANLRMYCFNIDTKSFNQIKNIAGNIVPAIASTNSIVSGIEIVQMIKLIKNQKEKMRSYFIQNLNSKIIGLKLEKNLQTCQICNQKAIPVIISADLTKYKLIDLINMIKTQNKQLQQFSLNYGSKQFYNTDQPNQNLYFKTIFELCSSLQVDFIVTNEDTMKKVCIIWLIHEQGKQQKQIINLQMLSIKIQEQQKQSQNQKLKQLNNDNNNNDDVVFDDDSDLEIIQVKKNQIKENVIDNGLNSFIQNNIHQEQYNLNNHHEQIQIIVNNINKSFNQQDNGKLINLQSNQQIQQIKQIKAEKRQIELYENNNLDEVKKKVKQNDQ